MLNKNHYKLKSSTICINKTAHYHYVIEEIFESGLVLQGWEIKSIRSGRINLAEGYIGKHSDSSNLNEMYLYNSIIEPLHTTSNHFPCDPTRKRKLLLHKNEINYLSVKKNRMGYTLIALSLFWSKSWCKLKFALAKGKNKLDKREEDKKSTWQKEKLKILKKSKILY